MRIRRHMSPQTLIGRNGLDLSELQTRQSMATQSHLHPSMGSLRIHMAGVHRWAFFSRNRIFASSRLLIDRFLSARKAESEKRLLREQVASLLKSLRGEGGGGGFVEFLGGFGFSVFLGDVADEFLVVYCQLESAICARDCDLQRLGAWEWRFGTRGRDSFSAAYYWFDSLAPFLQEMCA